MAAELEKLPTPEKPRIVFHVRCFGTEITGLIYTETNRYTGKQQWIFRVDMDGVNSAAKCEWQTEREAVANAEEFQKNHLRFQLETMCDDVRQQIGLEPLNQENRPMSEHAQ